MKKKLILMVLGLGLVAVVTGCHTTYAGYGGYGYVTSGPAYYYSPGYYYYPGPGCR